jgi:hypothetical protein
MKVIIAGSRTIKDSAHLMVALNLAKEMGIEITEVVSGGAAGADRLGEAYAVGKGLPIKKFLPDWNKHGRAAGPIRNKEMVKYADALIALWDGHSTGTSTTIMYAQDKGIKICVYNPPEVGK